MRRGTLVIDVKTRRKEYIRKTKTLMGGKY
jgi:hypothetical protein